MTTKIKVSRDSVAMGDDCTAPNQQIFEIQPDTTLAQFCELLIEQYYLPSIQGGCATWVLTFQNQPLAVIAQQWEKPRYITDSQALLSIYLDRIDGEVMYHFWVDYEQQKDPDKIYQLCLKKNER